MLLKFLKYQFYICVCYLWELRIRRKCVIVENLAQISKLVSTFSHVFLFNTTKLRPLSNIQLTVQEAVFQTNHLWGPSAMGSVNTGIDRQLFYNSTIGIIAIVENNNRNRHRQQYNSRNRHFHIIQSRCSTIYCLTETSTRETGS